MIYLYGLLQSTPLPLEFNVNYTDILLCEDVLIDFTILLSNFLLKQLINLAPIYTF